MIQERDMGKCPLQSFGGGPFAAMNEAVMRFNVAPHRVDQQDATYEQVEIMVDFCHPNQGERPDARPFLEVASVKADVTSQLGQDALALAAEVERGETGRRDELRNLLRKQMAYCSCMGEACPSLDERTLGGILRAVMFVPAHDTAIA